MVKFSCRGRHRNGINICGSQDCDGNTFHSLYPLLLGVIGYNTGYSSPDVPGVVLNGAVTGELTTLGYVVDHHGQPAALVLGGEGDHISRGTVDILIS